MEPGAHFDSLAIIFHVRGVMPVCFASRAFSTDDIIKDTFAKIAYI
jgi:hypothetical protein